MDPCWEFQAPQFVDFTMMDEKVEEDKKADDFFDVDMESGELWVTARSSEELEERYDESQPSQSSSKVAAATVSNGTFTVSSTSSSPSKLRWENLPQLPKPPLFPKVNKPSNLVTSWGRDQEAGGPVNHKVKKRRRLSNAIVHTLMANSGNNNQQQQRKISRTPRRKLTASILGYKGGATPKRLKTNLAEPRLVQNVGRSKGFEGLRQGSKTKKVPTVLTVPKPFKLSTVVRAEERKVFDEKKKKEEKISEEIRRSEKEREDKERKAQMSNYRKTLIHKPQPIKTFKCIDIKRSEKKLTRPESPNFVLKRPKIQIAKII